MSSIFASQVTNLVEDLLEKLLNCLLLVWYLGAVLPAGIRFSLDKAGLVLIEAAIDLEGMVQFGCC